MKSHFRVPPGLCFKSRVGGQPLIWKSVFIVMQKKTHFHKKGCAPSLILKVRVFGTRKPWPITTLVLTAAKFVVCFFFFLTITIMNLDMTDK